MTRCNYENGLTIAMNYKKYHKKGTLQDGEWRLIAINLNK